MWLALEKDWNRSPIPPRGFRTLRLKTNRRNAPAGSALPRYTYLTVTNFKGESARLLVQDNGGVEPGTGRPSPLGAGERSIFIPQVVTETDANGTRIYSRLVMTNLGVDVVPVELYYTPEGADGFDASVKRAAIVIPPNDVVNLTDPLAQIFGVTGSQSGRIEIRGDEPRLGQLVVTSRVERQIPGGGRYGHSVPVIERGEGARVGSAHRHTGLRSSADTKTDLVLAETSGRDKAKVRLTLHDNTGAKRGEQTTEIARYGSKTFADAGATFNAAAVEGHGSRSK